MVMPTETPMVMRIAMMNVMTVSPAMVVYAWPEGSVVTISAPTSCTTH